MIELHLLANDGPRIFELGVPPVVIGRDPGADVCLRDSEVSRSHARIDGGDEGYTIKDLGSRNGTLLNGKRLDGIAPLRAGDIIAVATSELEFRVAAPHAALANTASVNATAAHTSAAHADPEAVVDLRVDLIGGHSEPSTVAARFDASLASGSSPMRPEDALRAVQRVTSLLTRRLSIEAMLSEVLDTVLDIFPASESGVIMLLDANGELQPLACRGRSCTDGSIRVSCTVLQHVMDKREAVLSKDAVDDDRFASSASLMNLSIRSLMCAPLLDSGGKAFGAIEVHAVSKKQQFTTETLDLLLSVARSTAMAVENTRLNEQRLQQDRMERDLMHAREVQRSLLPLHNPTIAEYEFFTYYESALSVGGDYYGFVNLADEKMAIGVADVSGKGMSAAMMMARLSSDVRSALSSTSEPAEALIAVNEWLSESQLDDRFVTMVLLVLERNSHRLHVASAGHAMPMLRRANGSVEEIRGGRIAPPLNVTSDPAVAPASTTVQLEPGDVVLAYTDGVTEARNRAGEEFGADRVRALLTSMPSGPDDIGKELVAALQLFTDGCEQMDDTTVVCLGRSRVADGGLDETATMILGKIPGQRLQRPQ